MSPVVSGSWRVWLRDAESASGLALDTDGNVYVSYSPYGAPAFVRKYSPDATLLASWSARAKSIAVDSGGYVYAAIFHEFALRKFSPGG
jgi:hypothetical protein